MLASLSHIRNWIFDLDNTLYPASANLFALIDVKMGDYIVELLGCDAPRPGACRSSISTPTAPRWPG